MGSERIFFVQLSNCTKNIRSDPVFLLLGFLEFDVNFQFDVVTNTKGHQVVHAKR